MHPECIERIKKQAGDWALTSEDIEEIDRVAKLALSGLELNESFKDLKGRDKVKVLTEKANHLLLENGAFALSETLNVVGRAKQGEQLNTLKNLLRYETTASVEARIKGEQANARKVFADFEDLGSKNMGFSADPITNEKLTKSLRGVETDDPQVNKFGKAYRQIRDKLTATAGKMGLLHPLDNWKSPQPDDALKLRAVGKQKWIETIMPWVDKKVYDQKGIYGKDLTEFLGHVWETKESEGRNKTLASGGEQQAVRRSAVGSSRKHPRHLFLLDEHYSDYNKAFGKTGLNAEDLVRMTIDPLIRDIEIARNYGVNADTNFNWVITQALTNDLKTTKTTSDVEKMKGIQKEVNTLWERLTVSSEKLDHELDSTEIKARELKSGFMAFQVAKSFGSQVFSAMPETVNCMVMGSHRQGMSFWSHALPELRKQLTDADYKASIRAFAPAGEMAITGMMNEFHNQSRFVSGLKVLADKTIKWQGLKALDKFQQNLTFGFTSAWMGEVTRGFKSLEDFKARYGKQAFKTLVEDYGFTQSDMHALSKVDLESGRLLTPDGIRDCRHSDLIAIGHSQNKSVERMMDDLASKMSGYIWSQIQDNARGSVGSSLRDTKYTSSRGGIPGLSLVTQFLTTPISMAEKHLWAVPKTLEGGANGISAWSYRAKFLAFGIILEGVVAGTARKAISGQELDDYTDPKTLVSLTARTLTHYDRFFNEYHDDFKDILQSVPVASTVIGLGDAGLGVARTIFGEDEEKSERANAELAREIANNIPLKNLFYIKAAFQKMVIDNLCEYFNEGYKERLAMNRELRQSRSYIG
ncbi:hypothetical protein G293_02115 [Candidatus Liberibacter africanus PTSAPSY]|uniref:Uncharacterized protein n=1 Tax=Candidatus Liberibacter africanus PTSAPSY TaxID=1277257 RepID=A0A0G3I4A0_LIBAF|nr:hypothetical protein G293_02115 [Candidatus Liberibacter africanus PTSAPSY]